MKIKIYLLTFLIFSMSLLFGEVLFEEDFENGIGHWYIKNSQGVSISKDAYAGSKAMQVEDKSTQVHIETISPAFKIKPNLYRLTGKIKIEQGYGPLLLLDIYDENDKKLGSPCLGFSSAPKNKNTWQDFTFDAPVPYDNVATMRVRVVSLSHVQNKVKLDNLKVETVKLSPVPPNWEPQYKNPQADNPADFHGPNNIVWPNFYRAGKQGGIPETSELTQINLDEFEIKNDGSMDIYPALQKAVKTLETTGGMINIPEGIFKLSNLLAIENDNIIIKGAGQNKTRIVFDYKIPSKGATFYNIAKNEKLSPQSSIVVFAEPENLQGIQVILGNTTLKNFKKSMHSGNMFSIIVDCKNAKSMAKGNYTLKAICTYSKGKKIEIQQQVSFDPNSNEFKLETLPEGAIEFKGKGLEGKPGWIANDIKRGDTEIQLNAGHIFQKGDFIVVSAKETDRRRKETLNTCSWGEFRTYMVEISDIQNRLLKIDQPVRLEFPKVDLTSIRKISTIKNCGIMDLTIDVKSPYRLSTVYFKNAVNCFAKNVTVIDCGRFPIYSDYGKFITISNCIFDGAQDIGVGGSGYTGFDKSWDCLMDKTVTYGMRHAPLFQWSASGNVVRRSQFHDSDMHWHAGWSNENLVEQCLIDALHYPIKDSGYGDGMYCTSPEDGSHGPNGPRNVVYNNDIIAEKNGISLGGMNENWIIAENRIHCLIGSGVYLKTMAFDIIIKNNIFMLKNSKAPMVVIASPDCTGVEITGNILSGGNGKFTGGLLAPSIEENNSYIPYQRNVPPQEVEIPSIYEYQLEHLNK